MESYAGITVVFFPSIIFRSCRGLASVASEKSTSEHAYRKTSIQENDTIWNVNMNKELHVCNKAELYRFFFLVEKVALLV